MKVVQDIKSNESQTNAERQDNTESLISREDIKDSPFTIISMEGYHFGTMGDYRLTDKSNDIEEIRNQLESITWNRIIQVMMILEEVKHKLNNKINKETE